MPSKSSLRKSLKALLKQCSPAVFKTEGANAARLLSEEAVFKKNQTVLLFMSMDGEIASGPVLDLSLMQHKKVFAPRVEGRSLVFYRVRSAAGPWLSGFAGIREPLPLEPLEAGDFPALILVPGLGFDRGGRRLGRGGAYYDRFLGGLGSALGYFALGFCISAQVLGRIPAGPRDRPVHGILSGAELYYVDDPIEPRHVKNKP